MKQVSICVQDAHSRPISQAHVSLEIVQFPAGCRTHNQITDGQGHAEFLLDTHDAVEVSVYINHRLRIPRGPIQDAYQMRLL